MLASSSSSARLLAAAALLVLAGCTEPEVDWPGTWRPMGANDENLYTMLANPQDAYGGSGALTARGDSGARAVTRILVDRRRPLLDVSTSRLGGQTGSGADTPLNTGGSGGGGGGGASTQ